MPTTLTHTLGRFVWRELFTRDIAAAKRFYGALFGWTTEDRPMGPDWSYTIVKTGDKEIAGMMDIAHIPGGGEHVPPHWAVYVSVADVDAAAASAVAEGGKVLGDCMDIPNVGRFAVVQDPQGAIFNLFRSANGDPADDEMPGVGEFCWESLSTTNPAAAVDFYQKVVGWGVTSMPSPEGPMPLFTRQRQGQSESLASVGPSPDGQFSAWGTFVGVESVDATVAKAEQLGAKIWLAGTDIPDVGRFAVLEDPTGAAIYVFQAAGA